ncbi:hypothetical protein [Candidatus Kuenenia stuttgartiensis]|uniref:hypothetical protein n=1 Tax=Kuenenia stuttgartiensis TaxID=174633 RepID=UPI00146F5444|nr:hypothetical protein [Candidatus Kuenenia stuttgartiensis]
MTLVCKPEPAGSRVMFMLNSYSKWERTDVVSNHFGGFFAIGTHGITTPRIICQPPDYFGS